MTVAPPFPTQGNTLEALRTFLLAVLPAGVEVVAAQDNRVPEPKVPDFVVMTPKTGRRLATNIDDQLDCRFNAQIAATTLSVSSVSFGTILPGATVFGVGIAPGTTIVSQTSGTTGGVGVYVVSISQTVAPEVMATGQKTIMQENEQLIQLDFHSDDQSRAGDMADTVSTLFRDEFATQHFADQVPNYGVSPLHADDSHQRPFFNDQQQAEWVWSVDALLQANVVLFVPAQFADSIDVDVISVDATYPP